MKELKFRAWQKTHKYMTDDISMLQEGGVAEFYYGDLQDGIRIDDDWVLMQFTGLTDSKGVDIYEGDRMRCKWLAELGITEIDCEAVGTVVYKPAIAAYVLEFDNLFCRHIGEEGVYEEEQIQLREYNEDETISFEIVESGHAIDKTTLTKK